MNQVSIILENIDSAAVQAFFSLFSEMESKYKDLMVMADPAEVATLQAKIRFLRDLQTVISRSQPFQHSDLDKDGAYV